MTLIKILQADEIKSRMEQRSYNDTRKQSPPNSNFFINKLKITNVFHTNLN